MKKLLLLLGVLMNSSICNSQFLADTNYSKTFADHRFDTEVFLVDLFYPNVQNKFNSYIDENGEQMLYTDRVYGFDYVYTKDSYTFYFVIKNPTNERFHSIVDELERCYSREKKNLDESNPGIEKGIYDWAYMIMLGKAKVYRVYENRVLACVLKWDKDKFVMTVFIDH